MTIYLYDKDNKETNLSIESALGVLNTTKSKLMYALKGDKGYGRIGEYNVSFKQVTIMTSEQEMLHFNDWCSSHLGSIRARLVGKVPKGIQDREDSFQDVCLYVSEKIYSGEGVINYEATLTAKGRFLSIDESRKKLINKKNGFEQDFSVNDESETSSVDTLYIDTFAEHSLFDNGSTDNCLNDVNKMKTYEIVTTILYEYLPKAQVDLFIDYHQEFGNGKRKKGEVWGMKGVGLKYNIKAKATVAKRLKEVEDKIKELKQEINASIEKHKYPSMDEITLKNIIFDSITITQGDE
jgi:hypothetical protein